MALAVIGTLGTTVLHCAPSSSADEGSVGLDGGQQADPDANAHSDVDASARLDVDGGEQDSGTQPVGPEGATISQNGATLTIPAGALTSEVPISVARLDALAGLAAPVLPGTGEALTQVGPLYEFTPHGTRFAKPVRVSLSFSGTARWVMRLDDRSDPTWEVVSDPVFQPGRVSFETNGFSVYGVFAEQPVLTPCEKAKCYGDIRVCSATGASCWKKLPGVVLGSELGRQLYHNLTMSYATNLTSVPGALPAYAAFVNSRPITSGSTALVLAFFPLRADITSADVVQTVPFSLPDYVPSPDEVDPNLHFPTLTVRGIFPMPLGPSDGYVVVTELHTYFQESMVLLHVTPDLPFWKVRELRPTIGYTLPYEYADWSKLRLTGGPLLAVQEHTELGTPKLHLIAGVQEPLGSRHSMHRWTIPFGGWKQVGNRLEVDTIEVFDPFPLQAGKDNFIPASVAPGPNKSLAILAYNNWYDSDLKKDRYDVQLQLWDVSSARQLAVRSFENSHNAQSGESVKDCETNVVSTNGPALGHMKIIEVGSSDKLLETAAVLMSTEYNKLLYLGISREHAREAVLARCKSAVSSEPVRELLSARLMQNPQLETLPAWHQAFSSVWRQGNWLYDAPFATVYSPSADSDELRVVETWSVDAPYGFGVEAAVATASGHQIFARKPGVDGGFEFFTVAVNPDGTFATPPPLF